MSETELRKLKNDGRADCKPGEPELSDGGILVSKLSPYCAVSAAVVGLSWYSPSPASRVGNVTNDGRLREPDME